MKLKFANVDKIKPINDYVFKYYYKNNVFIKKYTNEKESDIINDIKGEHFPEIFFKKKNNKVIELYMPFYNSEEINYSGNLEYVKAYIKSLLVTIKLLHEKNYVHGDIKPDNFLYLNQNNYWLIDFDFTQRENCDLLGEGTYPFSAPEKNEKTIFYDSKAHKQSDLWSVGIILLFFLAEKKIFMENDGIDNKIYEYLTLYGKTNMSNIDISITKKINKRFNFKYDNNFIENNIKKNIDENDKKNVIDLIKQLLKLDYHYRINAENALKHSFFNNKKSIEKEDIFVNQKKCVSVNYNLDRLFNDNTNVNKKYYNYCIAKINNNFKKKNKYEQIKEFKICTICNNVESKYKLSFCEKCDNAYHEICKKKNLCDCLKISKFDVNYFVKIKTYMYINYYINEKFKYQISKKKLKLPSFIPYDCNIKKILDEKKLQFSDDLVYEIDQKFNNALLEFGIPDLSDENKKIFFELKKSTLKGEYSYVKICKNENEGYAVYANTKIFNNTLICEYSGNVFFLKDVYKKGKEENDSIMDLILTPTSDSSLVICPYSHANLGRFLSGVNCNIKKSIEKINVKSYKIAIDGSIHVILVSCRDIEKDEKLCYNYNNSYYLYDTTNFI